MGAELGAAPEALLQEAGLPRLPAGWAVVDLGSLLSDDRGISVGVMYPGPHDPQGVPLIRVADLSGSVINPHPELRISPQTHHEYRRTALEGGELLLTLVGGLGQCSVVPPAMAGWNAARAVAVIRLRDPADAPYVRMCLLSAPLQHLMGVWATTTVQATLNLKEIRQLPLPWPPRAERTAIAGIAGVLDDKIELNRRMNDTLEAMARALFRSWFVDFDPVRAKAEGRWPAGMDAETAALFPDGFQDSPLGKIPRGWKVSALDDIATYLNGLALQKYPPEGESFLPVIKIAQLRRGDTEGSDKASPNIPDAYIVQDGDVLFSWSGSLEVVLWSGGQGALNQHLFKVSSDRYPKWFYYLWTRAHLPAFQAIAAGKATTMGHIQRHHISQAAVAVPSPALMAALDRTMSPLVDKVIANAVESRALTALRDALLPKLLSGGMRVGQMG